MNTDGKEEREEHGENPLEVEKEKEECFYGEHYSTNDDS